MKKNKKKIKKNKGKKEEKISTPTAPTEVNILEVDRHDRYDDVYKEWFADEITSFERKGRTFTFICKSDVRLRIEVLSSTIVRFRYNLGSIWGKDFSYARDPKFRAKRTEINFSDEELYFLIETPALSILLNKLNGKVNIYNAAGKLITQDGKGFYARSFIHKGISEISLSRKASKKERFLGFGDKSSGLNLRGSSFENWVTDAFCYGEDTDPLYRSIPFYYSLNKSEAYGIFLDNTYRSQFDFCKTNKKEVKMSVPGGEMNYYFIYGPELTSIAQQYMHLTGKPELPPKWALGYHQCRWSYYPQKRVYELAATFRKTKIPCDSIYLDIDYMQGYRCFTWNKKYFPNPKKMIGDLRKDGFHTIVMIDPGLKADDPDYFVFKDGLKKDVFCKRPDGEIMKGPVWPSECVFPDFTNPRVRDWWGPLYKELYNSQGVSGFWNDMNEPAVFSVNTKTFPEDIRHDYEGLQKSHKAAHNIYGMQMSRASYDGFKKLQPKKRPFLLTRATFSGGQRYAAVWTGDNYADWRHLRIANRQCQRLSISGFSLVGSDVGGFAGQPDGELMVRWLQLAAFHPVYRVHSIGNNVDGAVQVEGAEIAQLEAKNRMDQEPWAYGEPFTKLGRQAIELRYRLIAYLYSAFHDYVTEGTPVIRSLAFYDQADENTSKTQRDFMFGEQLMVSPIVRPGRKQQTIYFPKGTWYSLEEGKRFKGGQKNTIKVALTDIPVFAKAGSAIALYPVQQHTNELKFEEMTLHAYYVDGTEKTKLYEDAGEGYDYQKDGYSLKTFTCSGESDQFSIVQRIKGKYKRGYGKVRVKLMGLPFKAKVCYVDREPMKIKRKNGICELLVDAGFKKIVVKVSE